ncbi:MAG: glutamate--tRNA ligase [Saprospiraceae bacterium]|nr:glutamate--tRNA ligase [Saprospiraceae bacterium]
MSVRVRFAPSPTGPLHIGGVRTALYNYLFARANNGTFILRIEDTDQTRYVEGAEGYIVEALSWCGLEPDEGPGISGDHGPYRQSERKDLYGHYAQQLVESGKAYYAFDTPEQLERMREDLKAEGVHTPKYDSSVRERMHNSVSLPAERVQALLDQGVPYTIRLLVPPDEQVTFVDRIRGEITFSTSELDDKVLLKTGGMPTYHLANVVDDHLMGITHVIRGEEWLSSTAHHVLLYRAFGWEATMPEFAHLPLILKPSGQGKLSKRDGAKFGFPVFPLFWEDTSGAFLGFREEGFLPEAMLNFLAFLGWNPGTEQEIFDLNELVAAFSLEQVSRSGARFDYDKALWFNSQYLQTMDDQTLAARLHPLLNAKYGKVDAAILPAYCNLFKERAQVLGDLVDGGSYVFEEPGDYDDAFVSRKWDAQMATHFDGLKDRLADLSEFAPQQIEMAIKPYIQDNGLRFGDVLQLLRCSVSGSPKGPDVFRMLALLDQETVVRRMTASIERFNHVKAIEHG